MGNRASLSLAREPSDGFSGLSCPAHNLSLIRLFYFQLSATPQPDALSHPLLTHAATSIVNATPQPLAPSSSPAVPVASPILTPLAVIRPLHGQIDNERFDVECKGQAVIIGGESYAIGNKKTADREDCDGPGDDPGDDAGGDASDDPDDDAGGDAGDGGLDEPIEPAKRTDPQPTQPASTSH